MEQLDGPSDRGRLRFGAEEDQIERGAGWHFNFLTAALGENALTGKSTGKFGDARGVRGL